MTKDKLEQFVAMIGGFLGALYLALNANGIHVEWLDPDKVDLWINVLNTAIPLALAVYGVWKNQYLVTGKARKQEKELQKQGLK
ncbi:phage holin [Abyssicoccus albus]|uniref:phage holin n=1 Tax=Abyssicoccus albus TaxID=1817405 RepID=UPI00097E3431|nr:phage holin [Abyssicoccus albus]AQL56408.1 PTS mannose transporter subunit IID [Abyssicoccus albus]